jgi:hypothetical protein
MKVFAILAALLPATVLASPTVNINKRDLVDDAAPHQDDPNFISAVMRAHWYWRRLHCAQDLIWDSKLADAARADVAMCKHRPDHVSG